MGYRPALELSSYWSNLGPVAPEPEEETPRLDTPQRAGDGPLVASSRASLVRLPEVIHDVNGYYRALGFTAPYRGITRKALREAYRDVGGPDDSWLTAVFKLLLDADKRFAYDCASLGQRHLDEIEQARLMAEAHQQAQASDTITVADVLDAQGFTVADEEPAEDYPKGEDSSYPYVYDEEIPENDPVWTWGYLRWGSGRADVARLATWQALLVSQLTAQEVITKFAVGFIGRGHTRAGFVVARSYGVTTFFLREDMTPESALAHEAIHDYLTRHSTNHTEEDTTHA